MACESLTLPTMDPTDPAFPLMHVSDSVSRLVGTGMDLRTYMATAFVAAQIAYDGCGLSLVNQAAVANTAVEQADALIERLNAK